QPRTLMTSGVRLDGPRDSCVKPIRACFAVTRNHKEKEMSVGLLIVDIQNDYFPRGKMELDGCGKAGGVAGQLLTFFPETKLPVGNIQYVASAGAPVFVAATAGVEIRAVVKPLPNETLIQKHFPNAFRETLLLDHLRSQGIKGLVISGMMTHMCVDAAARAAT